MASIHTIDSQNELLDYLRSELGDTQNSFWIGLTDTDGSYKWTDGSAFDFGNDTSGGIYPWGNADNYKQPDNNNDNEDCVETGDPSYWNNRWNDLNCYTLRRFICNDCIGGINKYKVLTSASTRTNAKMKCNEQYGTELASVHMGRDMTESGVLCNLVNNNYENNEGCWIGLYDEDNVNFAWDDGTAMDYGSTPKIYPGGSLEPNNVDVEKCVVYNLHNYSYNGQNDPMTHKWLDIGCEEMFYPICNAPSNICDGSSWDIISGNWVFGPNDCSLSVIDNGENSVILIEDEFNNYGNTVIVELMYSTQTVNGNNDVSGIAIINEYDVCQYYFVGISATQQELYLQKKRLFDDTVEVLQSESLSTYDLSTDYLLRAEVFSDNQFVIEWNTVQRINYSIDDAYFSPGFVGLQSVNSSINAKSMYVSGTNAIIDTPQYQHCLPTTDPTTDPTTNPIANPTTIPTFNPSNNPSHSSSKYPTSIPSLYPSNRPTSTINPSIDPTLDPTPIPSVNPTSNPTVQPTADPASSTILLTLSASSQSPSYFPSANPTVFVLSSTIGNTEVKMEINELAPVVWVLILVISCLSSIVCCLFYFVFCKMRTNKKRKEMNKRTLTKVKSSSVSTNTKLTNIVLRASPKPTMELPIFPISEEQMNQSSTEELYENTEKMDVNSNITPQPSPNLTAQTSTVASGTNRMTHLSIDRHSSSSISDNIFVDGNTRSSRLTSEGIGDV